TGTIAWHCIVQNGKLVKFEETAIPEADVRTEVDYQFVLPIARKVYTPEAMPEVDAYMAKGVAEGKSKPTGRDRTKVPPVFGAMHNDLAVLPLDCWRATMAETILYETPAPGIARVVLNRPETRNAQDTRLLYELNEAYDRATQDESIKVIITAANGPHFSSGHDLRERDHLETQDKYAPVTTATGYHRAGAEGRQAREEEIYTGFCERWRNIPKPMIAAVQGRCSTGGLMLCWPSDIILASDDAVFEDVTVMLGIPGVEMFAHAYELGPRKAKEMLFAG